MYKISITKGFYRGNVVTGVYDLVKDYVETPKGGIVTIRNPNPAAGTPPVQKIQVMKGDYTILNSEGTEMDAAFTVPVAVAATSNKQGGDVVLVSDYEREFMANETEEEAMERIRATFLMLDKATDSCSRGIIRGMVVSGPPGIGKSFGVEKQLEAANMFRTMAGKDPKYEVIGGSISAVDLYKKLYHNRGPENVVVFDDCDQVLFVEECLNLMKAALNSGEKRRVQWNKESRVLASDDIPNSFDFEASVIFLSNIDFERSIARESRLAAHLEAIMSRCHYLDLEIGSLRDRILRIKQCVHDGMLKPFEFSVEDEAAVMNFVIDNQEYLREVSLRMVKKVADMVKADPTGWYEMAEATCLSRDAKFKRLLEKKQKHANTLGIELQG